MLTYLGIHQISLVESARLDFSAGLNVLSGESGAGKSVVLDALAFVAGGTRPRCQLRTGATSGHVEALFVVGEEERRALALILDPLELPLEDELVLCRRLDRTGRSRCFVQGALVPLRTLAEVSALLLEFSDQGDSHALKTPLAQLRLLDACAGLSAEAARVAASYENYRSLVSRCRTQRTIADEAERRRDFLEFQLAELEACAVGEFSAAEARLEALESTRSVHDFCHGLELETLGSDRSLVERLENWDKRLGRVSLAIGSGLGDALSSALESLHQLGQLAARLRESHEIHSTEIAELELLVEQVRDVARKHRVEPRDLEARAALLRAELQQALQAEAARDELDRLVEAEHHATLELAQRLHGAREARASELSAAAQAALAGLGLPGARLSLQVHESALGPHGTSGLEVAFAGHAGAELRPLGRVASGGELGRVLLALRLATKTRRPLLVLDEIDAGAGGRAAAQIGQSLSEAASRGQVLAVSHWPQVACRAETHWVATKSAQARGACSELEAVSGRARVDELSRMLGGDAETARAHALALLAAAAHDKRASKASTAKRRKLRLVASAA